MNVAHDVPELAGVDLNLIVAFDALAGELSVTRAAERVGITQSAMSHALRRLRDLVGDPLLVRGRGGMVLTPRAQSLVLPLRSSLVAIGRALSQPEEFDASSARRAFTVATPDLFDVLAIPPLLQRIHRDAPGVDITVVPLDDRRLAQQLETGDADVAVVPRLTGRGAWHRSAASPGLLRRTLVSGRFTCLLRRRHPLLSKKKRLSLAAYASLSHAVVSPEGQGPSFVDEILAQHGISRRIALRVPHFYSALAIVAKSDLILTAPTVLARLSSRDLPVLALRPPIELPDHSIDLVWHERFSADPGHRWLRELTAGIAAEVL